MRIFIYKCLIVFFGIYLTYNFTIGKKIDQYESKLVYLLTDQGREQIREVIRKEIKNSLDNEKLLNEEDSLLLKKFINRLNKELGYWYYFFIIHNKLLPKELNVIRSINFEIGINKFQTKVAKPIDFFSDLISLFNNKKK